MIEEPTRDYICPQCGLTFYIVIEPCCGRFSRETFRRVPHPPIKPVRIKGTEVPYRMKDLMLVIQGDQESESESEESNSD